MKSRTGFTLIELLIVIAIIGILTAIVLTPLSGARQDSIDARIKAELSSISEQAEIGTLQTRTYDHVCGSNGETMSSEITQLVASMNALSSGSVVCNSRVGDYAVSVQLNNGSVWCIDSSGVASEASASLSGTDFACI